MNLAAEEAETKDEWINTKIAFVYIIEVNHRFLYYYITIGMKHGWISLRKNIFGYFIETNQKWISEFQHLKERMNELIQR